MNIMNIMNIFKSNKKSYNKCVNNNYPYLFKIDLKEDILTFNYLCFILYGKNKLDYLNMLSEHINELYNYDSNYSNVLMVILNNKSNYDELTDEEFIQLNLINDKFLNDYLYKINLKIKINNNI